MSRLPATAATLAALLAAAPPASAQQVEGLGLALEAADSILATPDSDVGLQSFDGERVTGVYLYGTFRGRDESIAYGIDPAERRYVWFSVRSDGVEDVLTLFDVDVDLTPDFILVQTIDRDARVEARVEYRSEDAPGAAKIDVQVRPSCAPPACDPADWTILPRETYEVPGAFFGPWRVVFALAATRGERWLGQPRSIFLPRAEASPR